MTPEDKEETKKHDQNDLIRRFVKPFQEALVCKSVELALQGDQQMLTLLLERMLPSK